MIQVNGATPLWTAARALLNDRGDDFKRRLAQVLTTFDPEGIHDLRVSSRRMREGLALFAPCYPPCALSGLGKTFKKVTRLLGEIRNNDETILFFASIHDKVNECCRSEIDRLLTTCRIQRGDEVRGLKTGLKKISAAKLCAHYRQVVNSPSLFAPSAADVDLLAPLTDFAQNGLSSRLAIILQLVPAASQEENTAAQHQLRIAVKHLRYCLEIVSFMFGNSYPELHTTVKKYQELLGSMHDLDVFAAVSREADFLPSSAALITNEIAVQRGNHFADFAVLLKKKPFKRIGEQLRNIL